MAVDLSLRSTSINPEPIRESPVDRSGAILGQGMAQAAGIQARGIYSEAQAAQNFGQVAPALARTAANATVGFTLAQHNKKINQEIQDYVDAKRDPQENLIGYAQAGVLEQESQGIWDRLGKGEVSSETFVDTVNAFDAQTKRLVKTYEQGLMQPSELVNRVMAITREHIARNPGLTDELFNQAQRTLQITGISSMKDMKAEEDKTAAELEKAAKKSLEEDLDKHNIAVEDWTLFHSSPAYRAELNKKVYEKKVALNYYNSTKQGYNLEEIKTKAGKQSFFQNEAPMQWVGFREEFALNISDILNSGADDATKLNQMEGLVTSGRARMAEYFGTKNVLAEPEAKVWMDQFEDFARGTVDQIRSAKTEADKLAIVKNQVQLQELYSELNLNDKLDPATRRLMASLSSDFLVKTVLENPKIGKNYLDALVGVLDDGLRNNSSINKLIKTEGSLVPDITDAAATMKSLIEHKQYEALDKVVDAYYQTQTSGKMSEVDHLNNMDDFYNLASRQGNIQQMSQIDDATERKFFEVTTNYMTLIGKSFNSFINSTREFRNTDFTVEEHPNGGILFRSANKEFETKLNSSYADRFNKIIKVSAPMAGISQKQSYERHKAFFDNTFRIGRGRETAAPGTFKPVQLRIEPRLDQIIEQQAQAHDLDPNLVRAVIRQESGGKTDAVSSKGALGLMQLMPRTAEELGVDPNNPAENIVGGIRYLKQQIEDFGSIELGLAAYNAGPKRVRDAGGIPNIKETQDYVKTIMSRLERNR